MRADRLVATLLILQARGTVTAAEIATELEISERTARRDLEALAMSGVPVYSRQGRGGGWSLIGGATTDLSGLSAAEARALFIVAGPSSSASPELKAALRKLVHALPEPFRADAEVASSAVLIDSSTWRNEFESEPPTHLEPLQNAVVEQRQVRLGYVGPGRPRSDRTVHPLGLIVKRGTWYLVGDTDNGLRTFRVNRVDSVEQLEAVAVRPEGFELERAWIEVTSRVRERTTQIEVEVLIEPAVLGIVRRLFGSSARLGDADAAGLVAGTIAAGSIDEAVGMLGGFGAKIRVHSPAEVIEGLRAVGRELADLYS